MTRRWAPIAAAVAVVAVAVSVSVAVSLASGSGSGSATSPPRLRLAAGSSADAAAPLAAQGKRAAAGSAFELRGSLPTGPDSARAQALARGAADEGDVRRLADALGVTGTARRAAGGWQLGILRVEDAAGNPWSLSGCGPDTPVSSDGGPTTSCASGSGSVSSGSAGSGTVSSSGSSGSDGTSVNPAPPLSSPCPDNARCAKPGWVAPPPPEASPPPPIDVSAARRAAGAVLSDLGLAGADVSVEPAGAEAFVRADPRVAGLATSGYTTQLEIDSAGHVVSGSGYLGRPSAGAAYPLVSARTAFDALPEPPRPMLACAVAASCPDPAPAVVTGAELGLQLTALADDEAALLPAWLFTVADWPMPLAQLAIEPPYLATPSAPPVPTDAVPAPPTDVVAVPPREVASASP